MSDSKQPEQMRPIPDGGLKDAMPSWLKRPPAWRDLPSAEERRERALPDPDTSEIDPRTLVDVNDLPQWLQAIAARGEIPASRPDAAVDHAVEVVQAASILPGVEEKPTLEPDLIAAAIAEVPTPPVAGLPRLAPAGPAPDNESARIHLPLWASLLIAVLMIALALALVTML